MGHIPKLVAATLNIAKREEYGRETDTFSSDSTL
jgi:hypothetical protein